jgi:hypothetical protein
MVVALSRKEGNQSQPMQWLTYDDPILQFSIQYPSTWDRSESKDQISFEIPDSPFSDGLDVIVEPMLTDDPSEYARDKLNEERNRGLELIGLNETTINGEPAYRAQYHTETLPTGTMALSYFMVTDDYTGYRLLYAVDDNEFTKYMPEVERMVNSFQITK